MSDLVERSDVIKMINRLIKDKDKCIVKNESFREGMVDGYCRVRSEMHDVPSASKPISEEDNPQSPTYWIHHLYRFGSKRYECPVCGKTTDRGYPYCPWCKAEKSDIRNVDD